MTICCEIPCGMGLKCTCGTPCMCCGYYPKDPLTSTFSGLIVFTSRTVKDAVSYKAAWAAYAEEAQGGSKGVHAMFSFMDKSDAGKAVQFAWYDSPEDFKSCLTQQEAMAGEYSGAADYATVWGPANESVQEAAKAVPGVTFQFEEAPKGFMRADGAGFLLNNAPMIWVSKRKVKPGMVPTYLNMWQKAADMQAFVAPGLIASSEKPTPRQTTSGRSASFPTLTRASWRTPSPASRASSTCSARSREHSAARAATQREHRSSSSMAPSRWASPSARRPTSTKPLPSTQETRPTSPTSGATSSAQCRTLPRASRAPARRTCKRWSASSRKRDT